MSNIRYEIPDIESVNFQPKLLYLTTSKYGTDWHSTPHYHSFSELMFILNGSGTFLLDNHTYPIHRGDLIIVNPNVIHTEYSSEEAPLEYVIIGVENILFDLLAEKKDDEAERSRPRTIFSFFTHYDKTNYYLQELNFELQNQPENYQKMAQYLTNILILFITRHTRLTAKAVANEYRCISRECAFVKQYIDEHYADDITLDFLAKHAFVNKFHLIHVFSEQLGISPINYLIERRITEAKFLLKKTYMNVTEISKAVGFSSPAFFSKRFKASVGSTPLVYRKQNKFAD